MIAVARPAEEHCAHVIRLIEIMCGRLGTGIKKMARLLLILSLLSAVPAAAGEAPRFFGRRLLDDLEVVDRALAEA